MNQNNLKTFILLSFFFFGVGTMKQSLRKEEVPAIAVNPVGIGKFQIAVINLSENPVFFGGLYSELGFDQFSFVCDDGEQEITVNRKNIIISFDMGDLAQIEVGGFCLFDVDLFDGTWELGGMERSTVGWKQVKVIYQPENCHATENRKARGIYSKRIESLIVTVEPTVKDQ